MSTHLVFSIFLSLVMDSSRFRVSGLGCCAYRITEFVSKDSSTSSLSRSVPTMHYSVSPLTVPPVSSLLCSSLIASWLTDRSFCKARLLSVLSQDICTWYPFFLHILHPDLSWLPLPPFSSFTSQIENHHFKVTFPGHPGESAIPIAVLYHSANDSLQDTYNPQRIFSSHFCMSFPSSQLESHFLTGSGLICVSHHSAPGPASR